MAAHLRACAKLDRSIRQESQARTIFDPLMRQQRAELRAECESALLADYRLSQKHDVERLLWKCVFYRPIEEFRKRIKQAEGELRAKTELAFQAFLQDAQAFYLHLAAALQQRYGPAGFPPALAAQQLQALGREMPQVAAGPAPADCRPSVHRCLVCLGDLTRYGVMSTAPAADRDWAACRHFYILATRAFPEGGNAYNQLAVLASYQGDDLLATYCYCRALAARCPFPVARENLVTHFEQARLACQRLAAPGGGGGGMRPASQAAKEFRLRSTWLLGMVMTRSELDAFPLQLGASLADLDDQLLRLRQQGRKAAAAAARGDQPPPLLQLAAAALYAVHASAAAAGGCQPRSAGSAAGAAAGPAAAANFAAVAQQQRVRGLALQLVFSLVARLAAAAAAAVAAANPPQAVLGSAAGLLLLPPLRVVLRWLAAAGAPVVLPPPPPQQPARGDRQQQQEPAELTAARQQLWQAAAQLVVALRQVQAAAAAAAEAGGSEAVRSPGEVVLPEGAQLAGFRHVSPAATSATGPGAAAEGPAVDPESPAVIAARLRYMLADAARIARVLVGGSRQAGPRGLADAQAAFVQAALQEQEEQEAAAAQEQQQAEQQQPQQAEQQPQRAPPGRPASLAAPPAAHAALLHPVPEAGTGGMELEPAAAAAGAAAAAPAAAAQPAPLAAEAAMEYVEQDEEEEEVILYAPPPPSASKPAAPLPPLPVLPGRQPPLGQQAQAAAVRPEQQQRQQPQRPQQAPQQLNGTVAPPPAGAAPAAPVAAGPGPGEDAEMADAEQTAQDVAGSVLPDGDRRASPPPPLPSALAAALRQQQPAAAAAAVQQLQPPPPPGPQPAEAVRLPAEFFSLFGSPRQHALVAHQPPSQLQQQLPPVTAAAMAAGQQQQQAAGLRALLFGGGGGGGLGGGGSMQQMQMAAAPGPLPRLPLPVPPPQPAVAGGSGNGASTAGEPLLSSTTAADRWAWMGTFGGSASAAGTAGAAGRSGPLPDQPPPPPWQGHAPPSHTAGAGLRTDNPFVP